MRGVGIDQENGQEPAELGVEMVPVALAGLRAELGEASDLARQLAGLTPEQADSSWCEQLEEEYHDVGVGQATMARQLARWRLDHPDAPGLDELAELVADVEPVRQALLQQLARLRCARGTGGVHVLPASREDDRPATSAQVSTRPGVPGDQEPAGPDQRGQPDPGR